jgi:hypothetical protein
MEGLLNMAIRMQQRRGTASQWTTANTILAAGEIGWESDTNKFKIGDGITAWTSLTYFNDITDLADGYIPNSQKGANSGVATLDSSGKLTASQLPTIDEIAQDAIDAALVAGTGITKTYNDPGNTITIAVASTIATKQYADDAVSTHQSDSTNVHGITDTANLVYTDDSRLSDTRTPTNGSVTEAKIADGAVTSAKIADGTIVNADIAGTAAIAATKISGTAVTQADTGTVTSTMIADGTIVNADINASAAIAQSKIANLTTDLAAKAPLAGPTLTGTTHINDLVIDGTLTFSGTATTINSTNLEVTDSLIYLSANQYDTDTVDIGIYGAYGDSSPGHFHTGLVRDASDGGKWKLISGGAEPTSNVVDFTETTKDTLVIGALEATSATIGNVSNTELQYLDGVTSAVQTQLDAKAVYPSQTGNSGKFLTTNGSATSWSSVDALPSQTGNSGKYLTTNGTVASWATLNASPALDDLSDVTITTATANDVVYYNGTTWVNKYVQAIPTATNAQSGTTYTLVLGDAGKIVEIANSSAITLTIPTNASVAFPVGTQITILQTGAGQITVADPSGGTLNATPGKKLRAQWSSATLLKRATDTWVLIGDLVA